MTFRSEREAKKGADLRVCPGANTEVYLVDEWLWNIQFL